MPTENPADLGGARPAESGSADAEPPASRSRRRDPVLSRDVDDATLPGVVIEVTPNNSVVLGAFTESALSEEDAWESNVDLESPEAPHGG